MIVVVEMEVNIIRYNNNNNNNNNNIIIYRESKFEIFFIHHIM